MFDVKKNIDGIIKFIKEYYKKNNLNGAVIGVSGGKDSAVVLGLLVKALGTDNVVGLTLPCHSKELDKNDAEELCKLLNVKCLNIDLTIPFDNIKNEFLNIYPNNDNYKDADINLKPRLRMASLYYAAALLSTMTKKQYLVVGTSNKCELYVGYFTKGGDSVHDIDLIADFTVDEVIAIGEYLNLPNNIIHKAPNDGLSNLTDEDKLGVKYSDIARCMENDPTLDDVTKDKIKVLHEKNKHKFNIPCYTKEK